MQTLNHNVWHGSGLANAHISLSGNENLRAFANRIK